MSKFNVKISYLGLVILAILALAFLALPLTSHATAYVTGYGIPPQPQNTQYVSTQNQYASTAPEITAISPDEAVANSGTKTVTVTGQGFTPSSVAKANGQNRNTTFIDSAHLLVEITSYDINRTDGGFYITVWNSNSKYSNAAYFKITDAPLAYNNSKPIGYYPGQLENVDTNVNGESLASSVILGGNTFLPSGIVQWVVVAILILFIIIIARKVFGAREHYDSTPMKHA